MTDNPKAAKKRLTLRHKEMIAGLLFISPWLFGFLFVFVNNMAGAIRFSLSSVNIEAATNTVNIQFVGLANIKNALTQHATFNRELVESITNMLVDVPLITFFSLFIAMLLNKKFPLRGAVRVVFFLPVIMATTAITTAISTMLLQLQGGVNTTPADIQVTGLNAAYMLNILSNFGIPLNILNYILVAVGRMYEIIRSSGVQILIFLAALQSIPYTLYEVAQIEGATVYEIFWKITFPMVSPLILTNVVYTIVDRYTQSPIVQTAYTTTFTNMNFGLGSTMSLLSALATSLVLLIVSFLISKRVFYYN